MVTLDDILHPITPAQFLAEYDDRKPLHIPAQSDARKREVLTWAAWNGLLNQTSIWSGSSLRLMRDHQAVPIEQYCRVFQSPTGPVMQPVPGKVELFLAAGASVVGNEVSHLHPPLTAIAATLSEVYGARIGANVYCSFNGVRAFGTHYDNHHVFVFQTEGEKVWNLYQARAENPVDDLPDTAETRVYLERTRGPVIQEVTMRPGDILYLPRGVYHDALTKDGASLHVTFSVAPLYGRILFSLLESAAMQNPAFRAYLPPAGRDGGDALGKTVAELGQYLARLTATPAFRQEVAMTQQRLAVRPSSFALPERKPITLYQTTGKAFPPAGAAVQVTYDWAIAERRFAIEDMVAQFDFVSEADVRAGVEAAIATDALRKV